MLQSDQQQQQQSSISSHLNNNNSNPSANHIANNNNNMSSTNSLNNPNASTPFLAGGGNGSQPGIAPPRSNYATISPTTNAGGGLGAGGVRGTPNPIQVYYHQGEQYYNRFLNYVTPYTQYRWLGFAGCLLIYAIRVLSLAGFYVVTYALSIYLLNLFLAFLTPKFDPAMAAEDELEEKDGPTLPLKSDEEFKPFIRRLPEFRFWLWATKATLLAFFCTFFDFFDIPVFWPVLLLYFIVLFALTMRRQINHMIKFKYVPFDLNKRKYPGGSGAK